MRKKGKSFKRYLDPLSGLRAISMQHGLDESQLTDLSVALHVALEALRTGKADEQAFHNTAAAINVAKVLAERAIDWVIVGGESGPDARPMVLGWAKDVARQCRAAGVPMLVKQLGANPTNREGEPHQISDRKGAIMSEWPEELRIREYPNAA